MNVYSINLHTRAVLDAIDRVDTDFDEDTGEVKPDSVAELVAAEVTLKGDIEGAGLYVRELLADAKAAQTEAQAMMKRAKALSAKAEKIKTMMLEPLQAMGGKVKTPRLTLSIRKTPVVYVEEGAELPEAYLRTKTIIEPDKIALKDALKGGASIPGASLVDSESIIMKVA